MIPILRSQLPCFDDIQNYLKSIDLNRIYSNYGPLHNELIAEIAKRSCSTEDNILLTSSGTSALVAVILYYKYSRKYLRDDFNVIVPNWTFAATIQSILALGGTPILIDVDPNTGSLDINLCRKYLEAENNCDMIIPVVPFGNNFDFDGWNNFSKEFNIPCCIDAAAAFFSAKMIDIPVCISLHATKGVSTGEGGLILCKDKVLMSSIKSRCNFGFENSRIPSCIGLNLKLSEYNAAVGLSSLENSKSFEETYNNQYKAYIQLIANFLQEKRIIVFTDERPKTTFSIRNCTNIDNARLTYQCLTQYGFEVRKWWGLPIDQTPISKYCEIAGELKNSSLLSKEVIGLPIGNHIDHQSQVHIIKSIANILN